MKRSKKLYILLAVLVVACVATFIVVHHEERKEEIANTDEVVLEIDSADVTALSWEYDDASFSFSNEDGWTYDEDAAFPVDEEKINTLLGQFESFAAAFIIENAEDISQYGLDDPVCTINIETNDESYEIKLGNYSSMDSERYVSTGDGNVYLVDEDPYDSFAIELKDMILNDEIPTLGRVDSMEFAGDESYSVVYEEDSTDTYCEEDVYFTSKDGKNKPLDTDLTDAYINTVSSLDLTEYVTYNASDEDIAAYGLDDPELSISIDYTYTNEDEESESGTVELSISRDPEEIAQAASEDEDADSSSEDSEDEEDEITAYARVGQSKIIYKITSDEYKALMAYTYNDLRHQEILSADFDDITQIDISLEGNDYTLVSKEEDDALLWYYDDEVIDAEDLQAAVEALTADSFTDDEPDGKEEISVTVHLDNENFPEVEMTFYRYDGATCIAETDGEPVAYVERQLVVSLIEAVNAIVLN